MQLGEKKTQIQTRTLKGFNIKSLDLFNAALPIPFSGCGSVNHFMHSLPQVSQVGSPSEFSASFR